MDNQPDIPGYNLQERIGEGGFGMVYLAHRTNAPDRDIAIKILKASSFVKDKPERFARECAVLTKLAHKAIVRLNHFGFVENTGFIVTDYISGQSLGEAVKEMDFVSRAVAMVDVLEALQFAHSLDILHRDIKPSNIMLRSTDKQAIVIDWGLAYVWDSVSSFDITTHYVGSLGYIPPEVQADPLHRSSGHDIYSAGVVLYEAMASRRPNLDSYKSLSVVDAKLVGLDPIVRRAMAPEQLRYQTAQDMARDLRGWVERQRTGSIGPDSALIASTRAALLQRKQLTDDLHARDQRSREALESGLRDLANRIQGCARAALEQVASDNADVLGGQWEVRELLDRGGQDQELLVLERKGGERRLYFARAHDPEWPLARGSKRALIEWPKLANDRERLQGLSEKNSPRSHALAPCWVFFDDTSKRAPSFAIHGGVCAYIGTTDQLTNIPSLLLYGRPLSPIDRKPILLADNAAIINHLYAVASAPYRYG
jgi:serine/threonine protein kinase